jgi:hypothetical protein
MEHPQSDRQEIKRRSLVLPVTGESETIDEPTALAILEDLKRNGSSIPEHIDEQIEDIAKELSDKVTGIPVQILQGIVARAAIAGAAQAISDTGQAQLELQEFRERLGVEPELIPTTVDDEPAA